MTHFTSKFKTLFTIGYNAWKAAERMKSLCRTLTDTGVTFLVDVRLSPCASDPSGRSSYGPKPWTLEAKGGIRTELQWHHIDYLWMPELGNPQKNDRNMKILKHQLADTGGTWPIHRGFALLSELVSEDQVCCLMCGCDNYQQCHRQVVAEALCGIWKTTTELKLCNFSRRGHEDVTPKEEP